MYQHKVHQSITCTVLQFSVENDIQMWKNTVCCFTMLYVNSLMQIDLFNNNNFSLFAFVLLLTLGYTHLFVCKGRLLFYTPGNTPVAMLLHVAL